MFETIEDRAANVRNIITDDHMTFIAGMVATAKILKDSTIGFSYRDVWIDDPFVDETCQFIVNPIDYYGASFLMSEFVAVAMIHLSSSRTK